MNIAVLNPWSKYSKRRKRVLERKKLVLSVRRYLRAMDGMTSGIIKILLPAIINIYDEGRMIEIHD